MDRIGPTRRPPGVAVGRQDWRDLLFLHWPVEVEVLRRVVPPALSIDTYQGQAYVGLIPFRVRRNRANGFPSWLSHDFLETNVRTYVHLDGQEPGVYFFSLDAASRLVVAGANIGLGMPYFYARMHMRREGSRVEYSAQRATSGQPRLAVSYSTDEPDGEARPGTLDHFLIERYLLHLRRKSTLWTVQVAHRPYALQQATVHALTDTLIGAHSLPEPVGPPPLVHFSPGVDVEIFPPRIRTVVRPEQRG